MQIEHYPYILPLATPYKPLSLDQAVQATLTAVLPERISKIVVDAVKNCGEKETLSYKTKEWDIVVFSKKAFVTERAKTCLSHVQQFSCKRCVMVTFSPDGSASLQEVERYSQAIPQGTVLRKKFDRTFSVMQRFSAEPCFAANYGCVQQGKRARFFQEKVGISLAEILATENHHLLEREKITICHGIAVAIDTMATAGFAHRGISPMNILISKEPNQLQIKLADFTHAARCNDVEAAEREVGNIAWAAPESIEYMCYQGKFAPTDKNAKESANKILEKVCKEGFSFDQFDFTAEVCKDDPKLLPDSQVDVWTLGVITQLLTQKKIPKLLARQLQISQMTKAFHLISSIALAYDNKNEKKLQALVTELRKMPFAPSAGPLDPNSAMFALQISYFAPRVSEMLHKNVALYSKELGDLPKKPNTLESLQDIANANTQLEPHHRLTPKATLDALARLRKAE
jgi:serine/threonine protein kinase